MQTARTLEAEWRQVLWGSMSMGAKEDESSTRCIWTPGFHHVKVRSHLAHFETYEPLITLSHFFGS
jgi:hypothetical protein